MSKLSEKDIQQQIINTLNRRPDVRVFRNNIGQGFIGAVIAEGDGRIMLKNYRRIRFGLQDGSGDLIGWKTIKITPEMVGTNVAVFTSIEVKSKTGTVSDEQKNWFGAVTRACGIAKIARSAEDGTAI